MEVKKNPEADLESKKGLYLEIGLVFVLAVVLVAFNIKSYDNKKVEISQRTVADEIEDVVIQTAEDTPPPPEPEAPEVVTELTIVEDDAVIRAVLEMAGIHDIRTKSYGTNNPINMVKATIEALKQMRSAEQVAKMRGKTVEEILG